MTKVIHMNSIIGTRMSQPIDQSHRELLIKLGAKIRSIRIEKKLTLEEVGKRIGKDRQSIHSLEKGSFNPSYIYLYEVCNGLEIELFQLFES